MSKVGEGALKPGTPEVGFGVSKRKDVAEVSLDKKSESPELPEERGMSKPVSLVI